MSLAGAISSRRLARHGGAPSLAELLAALPDAIEGESNAGGLRAVKDQLELCLSMVTRKLEAREATSKCAIMSVACRCEIRNWTEC